MWWLLGDQRSGNSRSIGRGRRLRRRGRRSSPACKRRGDAIGAACTGAGVISGASTATGCGAVLRGASKCAADGGGTGSAGASTGTWLGRAALATARRFDTGALDSGEPGRVRAAVARAGRAGAALGRAGAALSSLAADGGGVG